MRTLVLVIAVVASFIPPARAAVVPAACGNGTVDSGEGCDDRNVSAGDGCSDRCVIEEGYTCDSGGATNLVVNGNFDLGNAHWESEVARREDGGGAEDGEVSVRESPNSYVTNSCKHGLCLDGNTGGVIWKQSIEVEPATEYFFTAFFAVREDGSATSRLQLRVAGTPVTGEFDGASGAPAPWIPFGGTFTTGAGQDLVQVEIYNAYAGGAGNGFVVDEVAVVKKPSVCTVASGEPDAGVVEADAGEVEVEVDAGETPSDAGETAADAGGSTPDAGGESPDPELVGCACGAGNVGALVLLPLAGLLRRRRSQRS